MENQTDYRSGARNVFLAGMLGLGLMLSLAIHQVPQPWRGALVAWLLFLATFGVLIVKVLKHHYAYRALKLTAKEPLRRDKMRRRSGPGAVGLKVIESGSLGSGRSVIR